MSVEANEAAKTLPDLKLEPAGLEWSSEKTQLSIGFVASVLVCLAAFWQTTGIGFLLDDFLHLDQVVRAFQGDRRDFLSNLYANWGGSDLMVSYRPLVSLSVLADYLFWRTNAFGYHLTNLIVYSICALFAGLITFDLTAKQGNLLRPSMAIWAALLFLFYPVHLESVAWVIGRVDLFCTAFYLISVFAFSRFRILQERHYLYLSLAAFVFALTSKEMAVTLPVVLLLLVFLVPTNAICSGGNAGDRDLERSSAPRNMFFSIRGDLAAVGLFFAVLGLFAVCRAILLGSAVGGYGSFDPATLIASLANFADRSSIMKVAVPINEELHPLKSIIPFIVPAYGLLAAVAAYRCLINRQLARVCLFLIAWMVVALLPTFQIWHVYPNLVGSRLFFTSSAPFCMLLAIGALPGLDALSRIRLRAVTVIGTLGLVWIASAWAVMTWENMQPWIEAGQQMKSLRLQIEQLRNEGTPAAAGSVLLLDLPTDYRGAGMLTRSQYLKIIAAPPFAGKSGLKRLLTIEPDGAGSHEFVFPNRLASRIKQADKNVFRWSGEEKSFVPWRLPAGKDYFFWQVEPGKTPSFSVLPKRTSVIDAGAWHVESRDRPAIEQHEHFVRLYPGTGARGGLTVAVPTGGINPIRASLVRMNMKVHGLPEKSNRTLLIKLAWQSSPDGAENQLGARQSNKERKLEARGASLSSSASLTEFGGSFICFSGRYRSWMLNGPVTALGLQLQPGAYCVDLYSMEALNGLALTPALSPASIDERSPGTTDSPALDFDASYIPGARSLKLLVSRPGTTFDINSESEMIAPYEAVGEANRPEDLQAPLRGKVSSVISCNGTKGRAELPNALYNNPGVYEFQAVALDKEKKMVGLPGEPLQITVRKK